MQRASFNDKWNKNNLICTDKNESILLEANTNNIINIAIREKYIYYYDTKDLNSIIDNWKQKINGTSIKMEITNKNINIYTETNTRTFSSVLTQDEKIIKFIKLYTDSDNNINKKSVMITSLTHAREPASLNVNIAFVDQMIDEYINNKSNTGSESGRITKFIYHILLISNPIGRFYDGASVVKNNKGEMFNVPGIMYRKNGNFGSNQKINDSVSTTLISLMNSNIITFSSNSSKINEKISQINTIKKNQNLGIDLNRNCGGDKIGDNKIMLDFSKNITNKTNGTWGFSKNGSSSSILDDTYRGSKPNSEAETKILQEYLIQNNDIALFIALHSYSNQVISNTTSINNYPSPYSEIDKKNDRVFYKYITKNHDIDVALTQNTESKDIIKRGDLRFDSIYYSSVPDAIGYSVDGDTVFWWSLLKYSQKQNQKNIGYTLEIGNMSKDGFYPNKYEMIDIVYNGVDVINRSVDFF